MKGVIDDIQVRPFTVTKSKRRWYFLFFKKADKRYTYWELLEDFDYYGIAPKKGFVFNFASIPRMLYPFINPVDPGIRAASLIHDWLFHKQGAIKPNGMSMEEFCGYHAKYRGQMAISGEIVHFSFKACNGIFNDIMRLRKFGTVKRIAAHGAVSSFGRFCWRKSNA